MVAAVRGLAMQREEDLFTLVHAPERSLSVEVAEAFGFAGEWAFEEYVKMLTREGKSILCRMRWETEPLNA